MSSKSKDTITEQLHRAQLAIDNTIRLAVIQSAVTPFGYGPDHMEVGRGLYESAQAAVLAQRAAFGAQQNATARVERLRKEARIAFQDLAKVARAIYARTPNRLVAIGLNKKMPLATADFITAAYILFDNAQLKAELADFGYDSDRLASERAKIAAFSQANDEQEEAKGAAQDATQHQRSAMKALNHWVAQYLKIARVALRDRAQLLEKIGVKVRVAKTAAQRQAPKKAAATRAARKAAGES